MKNIDVEGILRRVKNNYKFNSDKELADYLEVPRNTLATWKSRSAINWDLLLLKCSDMNFEYLIKGDTQYRENGVVRESIVEYSSANTQLMKENQELKIRLEECRETVSRLASGQRNTIYGGKVAATPPED